MRNTVIELTVRNDPGVMSHVSGLLSRHAFNLEGIICGPIDDGSKSRIYLLIHSDNRLQQVIKHLERLYDVFDVSLHKEGDYKPFNWLYKPDHCDRQNQDKRR